MMMIEDLMEQQHMSKYQLSKSSRIPYSTVSDLCRGKTSLEKCSAETVYRLAKTFNVTMEHLLAPHLEHRCSFDVFKSNVCHNLKETGDIDFLIKTLEGDEIRVYYDRSWYPESFYLLGMVDYLCRINHLETCNDYNDLRTQKLSNIIYPSGILALCAAQKSNAPKEQARQDAIPEFMRFNIVECEVRDAV